MRNTFFTTRWLLPFIGVLLLSSSALSQSRTIKGKVIDEQGEALPFVSIYVPANASGTQTDMDGRFTLNVPQDAKTIEVSFIGYKKRVVQLSASENYDIRLESETQSLSEVVIVGNMERKKESFTGSFSTVSGSELKQVGGSNLVENLKSLDPSFVVVDNTIAGADPNAMPTIEVRGQTSVTTIGDMEDMFRDDPNQPLFILDGFETTLQKIIDLDQNRIQSVNILKDAASTAFYGSRAANGVIVVETIKGVPGPFKVFYTGDFSMQTPNLSSYNLMNAAEKLQFELLSGRYVYRGNLNTIQAINAQERLNELYYSRLADIQRGVDSYWMSDPLQIPIMQRHSFRMSGGTEKLMMNAGLSYRNAPGVMKGSKRNSWSADLDLTYNHGSIAFVNMLSLNGYTSAESPYGSFSEWAAANPYYRKTREDGTYAPYLDQVYDNSYTNLLYEVINPLFVAGLNSKNETRATTIDERFNVRWNIYKGMRLEGLFQLAYNTANVESFNPPEHPNYKNAEDAQKGNYSNTNNNSLSYTASVMYSWNNVIGDHSYQFNARGEVSSRENSYINWQASGYPVGTNGAPSYSNAYSQMRPTYSNPITRRANLLLSLNYAYRSRYLLDLTFREDGSTVFGSEKQFTPFWSTGIGWNLHEEDAIKSIRPISLLRLRASIGQTGNQNLGGSSNSTSIYNYQLGGNVFGQGLFIGTLGNPNVEWQKTTVTNLALELNLFDNRFTSKFDVFRKLTSPLVVMVSQAPSTGASYYPMSLGNMEYKGFEFDISYSIIRTSQVNWRVRLMGAMLKGKYGGFSDKLAGMDAIAQNSNSLQRYRDGYSPKALWAVRSLGIDPTTGQEMFLTKEGVKTFVYDPADAMYVGVGEPKLYGTVNSYINYKNFTFTFVLRYSLKEERFNGALFNKVENISMEQVAYNQDRRALYDRWQKPGDISQFKSINLVGVGIAPNMSNRFIQTESYISGESIGLTYRFDRNGWIKDVGMERLDLTATAVGTSGVFRLTNVQLERGTSYPEAYTFTLSVSATF